VVDTGFGGVTTASTDTKASEQSEQTPTSSMSTVVTDTGEPTEADADLDAKIANLLK
jgi:hypothetical protein